MTTRIKLRRDTAANWTSNDPVLALGEAGYDTTNNELRVGDGTTVWSGLESIGGTGNKITALKTYSDNHNDGDGQTFTYTTGSIAVQMGNDEGLYLDDLLSRLSNYFDGNTTFPYNYSNVSLVINPGTTNLSTTVTDVISQGGTPRLYTITLATTNPGPIAINDIDFNYNYINTIGLDIEGFEGNGYFGMATGDDDITIRSGRDITLDATDDIYVSAGDYFELKLVNLDDSGASSGIQIVTETTASSYTWTFRFDGHLRLPEGLSLPTKTNTGYEYDYTLTGPTLRLSNDSQNQVIVTGPATTEANPSAQRIVIQGQRGYGSTSTQGEGGDIYIWGGIGGETNDNSNGWGPGGGSGGDIKLRGGEGLNDNGGYVRIEGGNVAHFSTSTTGDAGFVEITGGDVVEDNNAVSSLAGNVTITGGRAYSASTQSGIVQVITGGTRNPDVLGANTWTFSNDGSLTIPGPINTTGTLVVDSLKLDFGGGFMFYNTTTNEVTHNPYVPLGMMQGPMQTLNNVTTGTNTFDCDNGHIFYVTAPQGDWTVNFINANNFYPDQVIAMSIIIDQGATAYLPTAVQVQGYATTLCWLNNTPPTGTADRTNVVAYRIICTATNTYKVLAQLMAY